MKAVRFDSFGGLDQLYIADLPDPVVDTTQAIVEIRSGSVNPSDLKNIGGHMEGTVLPRTPGRDYAGVIVSGPDAWLGVPVWGTGGEIGYTQDGSHAEFLSVPVAALVRKPETLNFDQAASAGVNYMVALRGIEVAHLHAGETIVIIGIRGGVGCAVAQIARHMGAHVIGIGRSPQLTDDDLTECVDAYISLELESEAIKQEILELTHGKGAEVIYDTVGGITTNLALDALCHRGKLIVIASTGTRMVEIDLIEFYRNETQIMGVDSRKLDSIASAQYLQQIAPLFDAGIYTSLPVAHAYPLDEAINAYRKVAEGANGKVVINP